VRAEAQDNTSAMDIFQSVQGYINKMVSQGDTTNGGAAKMKILLLDKDTVRGGAPYCWLDFVLTHARFPLSRQQHLNLRF